MESNFSDHHHELPHHDIGGDETSYGPITTKPEALLAWEQQCHALFAVLAMKKLLSTDELRRAIEALLPNQYTTWSYYEKWTAGMVTLLMEHGIITYDELRRALFGDENVIDFADTKDAFPIFQVDDIVRVKAYSHCGVEYKRPHIRTPGYVYGVAGTIERVCSRHSDPSFLAFGLKAPTVQLYRVRFRSIDLWPENKNTSTGDDVAYRNNNDVVEVEIYEHWLEKGGTSIGHAFQDHALFDHRSEGKDCTIHHNNHHHEVDHSHDPRPMIEERAACLEGPPRPGQELFQALVKILLSKDIITTNELRIMTESMDAAGIRLDGASLVIKAWLDPSFEERLLNDAPSAAMEIGISTSNPNAPTILTVVKNTLTQHNLVVCTLCSCYPSALLGIAPSWYKSREYRSRAVREPRKVLREFGLEVPHEKQIRVHDSTADHRYLVLPERPIGTEGWSEDKLRALVTRDTMIGVAVCSVDIPTV